MALNRLPKEEPPVSNWKQVDPQQVQDLKSFAKSYKSVSSNPPSKKKSKKGKAKMK